MTASTAKALFCVALSLPLALSTPALGARWTASVDVKNGLPSLAAGGVAAVSSDFVFWRKDWSWAGLTEEFKVIAPFEYSIVGKNLALNFDLVGRIEKPSSQQLVWEFDLTAASATPEAIGGGISFKLNLPAFASQLGEPEIFPGNRGWAWGSVGADRIEMRFDPPMAAVYFERGQKSEIRAFFYKDAVPQGFRHHVATLTVSGDVAIGPTTTERFGLDDPAEWPTGILDWQTAPVDLSFLNAGEKPAGKRGFVRAVKDQLVFADGTPARFWGTNLTAYALFGTILREDIKIQAHRLSQLGFNLVRLHHHDSPWVSPNVFGRKPADTRTLSPESLATLDWWIKCLEDEGIYIWLDLHVQRQLTRGDGIAGFDEISHGKPTADLKGYNYVNASIQQAMQRFNDAYVSHTNTFTGKRYKDDPAIIAMLLTNENDITQHFGNALLPDKKVPTHNGLYMVQAEKFAAQYGLPKDKTWRSWEHGPSKLFLNDLEDRFNVGMIGHLRALGVKTPIVTTSTWGDNPLGSLPALTAGDIIDAHSYGGAGELEKNPIYGPNLIDWIAAAQIVDRPLSATEWAVSFAAPDRHAIPLYLASTASLQGWDALMQFAYSQQALSNPGRPSNWDAFNDPALIATLPAAALLYRRGDVRQATTVYVFAPTREQLFNEPISPANAVALRTAAEKGRLIIAMPQTPELPWLEKSQIPPGATLITDPQLSLIDSNASEAVSDTGELKRDWDEGIYAIDTPRTQAAMGWIGGREITLADVRITAMTRNATVAVQSLDGSPIAEARTILISLGARSAPTPGNKLPFRSEPVMAHLTIRAPKGLKLYARSDAAGKERAIPVGYESGLYRITLDRTLDTRWLVLR